MPRQSSRRSLLAPLVHSNEVEADDFDIDAPRAAQWMDEEDVGESDENKLLAVDNGPAGANGMSSDDLQASLSALPLGSLRRAHRTLAQDITASRDSDSDDKSFSKSDVSDDDSSENGIETPRSQATISPEKANRHRANKHAPQEVSSKRPVSRRRQVVQVQKLEGRDPRFQQSLAPSDESKFRAQYSFLADIHMDELTTLRENLKRARKMLLTSPKNLREERQLEVEKLERAYKRAESLVDRDKRIRIENEALARVTHEEKEKRKKGKRAFYLKSADKKKLFLSARYDAMADEGGQRAVKKAIEKKRKKISQKETKSRPFSRPTITDGDRPVTERGAGSNRRGDRHNKRPRFG